MATICIIPARGGSTRIPNKNIKDFHGKPIIAYSIKTAKKSKLFDSIIVSTDSDEIAEVAIRYGADILKRPAEFCSNEVGTQEVMKSVLKMMDTAINDIACCIYATAPLMSVKHLKRGHQALITQMFTYTMSVNKEPLFDAGQFYWGWTKAFLDEIPLIGTGTALISIPKKRVCDINTMEDFERAKAMYLELNK